MDVINAYLETMFSRYAVSPRLAEAKSELREMMEDAYQAAIAAGRSENEAVGQVITEFGNLDELAPVLGITSELRPDEAPSAGVYGGTPAGTGTPPPAPSYPLVRLDEAQGFSEATRRTHPILAIAVALFAISPAPLIALTQSGGPGAALGSDVAAFVGLATLLVLVAIGVGMIVLNGRRLAPYSRISEGAFTPNPAVNAWAQQVRAQHEGRRITAIVVAVTLWILAALPVLASGLLGDSLGAWGEWLEVFGVPVTLVIVALGLLILIPTTWAESVAQRLARGRKEERAEEEASAPTAIRVIQAVLAPITVIIYLAWSFLTGDWHITWIVWPIMGLLFAVLGAAGAALKGTD